MREALLSFPDFEIRKNMETRQYEREGEGEIERKEGEKRKREKERKNKNNGVHAKEPLFGLQVRIVLQGIHTCCSPIGFLS